MKAYLLRRLRNRLFQPFWERLYRTSVIGMNFWASNLPDTGEREALAVVARRLREIEKPVIFDVGANVGEFTKLCLALFAKDCVIHAFEPAQATFRRLEDSLSGRWNDRVRLHNIGFGEREQERTLYSPAEGSTLATLYADGGLTEQPNKLAEQISLASIDGFCAENAIDRIDFLKLDVEGHEYPALLGAKRMMEQGKIRFIQFEFGENNVASRTFMKDFAELLGSRYTISRIVPGGLVPWLYRGGYSEIFATMNYLCERRDEAFRESRSKQ